MTDTRRIYIPALRCGWLTPLYDLVVRWTPREAVFKRPRVKQAHIQPGHHVLDLGCGTATLTILIKQRHPESHVIGLDGDPTVLALAKSKLADAEVTIPLDQGHAFKLPYPNQVFDQILTSLLLHHVTETTNGGRWTKRFVFCVQAENSTRGFRSTAPCWDDCGVLDRAVARRSRRQHERPPPGLGPRGGLSSG